MNGINIVINEKGLKTAILVDLNELRKNQMEGRDVTAWLETLEDIIIDKKYPLGEPKFCRQSANVGSFARKFNKFL
jgi:hypothetical protein